MKEYNNEQKNNQDSLKHFSVLEKEVIEKLKINPEGIYLDMTLGLGGHSEQIAKLLTTGKLIAVDQDKLALDFAKKRLEAYEAKIIFIHDNFQNIDVILKTLKIDKVDGILYDLGTSSYQLNSQSRGFSYRQSNEKLDMRMNLNSKISAINILNEYSEQKLEYMFKNYGDVKFARDLAKEIVNFREETIIEFSEQLNSIIDRFKTNKENSLNYIYQAIRIEVNNEIEVLKISLKKALDFLKINGIIIVITFHSLEDRVVKNLFWEIKNKFIETPKELIYFFKTSKTILPSKEEINLNKASRSAKLRIIKKIYEQ